MNSITTSSDPADIWSGADPATKGTSLYTFTANTGAPHYISSTSALDTTTLLLEALTVDPKGNWINESFTVTLQGQTKKLIVTPSGNPIVRLYRMFNLGSVDIVGTVYAYEDDTVVSGVPQTDSKVRAIIDKDDNQTLMSIYTIPSGYVGFSYFGDLMVLKASNQGESAECSYRSRRYGSVFTVRKKINLSSLGTTIYQDYRRRPDPIPAKADIVLRVNSVSATMGI